MDEVVSCVNQWTLRVLPPMGGKESVFNIDCPAVDMYVVVVHCVVQDCEWDPVRANWQGELRNLEML